MVFFKYPPLTGGGVPPTVGRRGEIPLILALFKVLLPFQKDIPISAQYKSKPPLTQTRFYTKITQIF